MRYTIVFVVMVVVVIAFVIWSTGPRAQYCRNPGTGAHDKFVGCEPVWATATEAHQYMKDLSSTYKCPVEAQCNTGRGKMLKKVVNSLRLKNPSFLDFGGKGNKYGFPTYQCLNLEKCSGTTCTDTSSVCRQYNGERIPFPKNSVDIVLSEFVLHHAAENTISLLQQLYNIAKYCLIVAEDVTGLNSEIKWQRRLFEHDPHGIFRSIKEWIGLFNLVGFTLNRIICLPHANSPSHTGISIDFKKSDKINIGGGPAIVYFVLTK